MLRRTAHAAGRDEGFVLPLVLSALVALGLLVAAVSFYATTNRVSTTRSVADQTARALADAGLNTALGTIAAAANKLDPNAVPAGSGTLPAGPSGSYAYIGALSGTTWSLTGTGTVTSAGSPPVTRRATLKVDVVTSTSLAWNYLYATAPSGCTQFINGVTEAVSVYTTADLCVEGNSHVVGAGTDVRVNGKLAVSGGSSIGTTSQSVSSVSTRLGCATDSYTFDLSTKPTHTCTKTGDFIYGPIVPFVAVPRPTVDWNAAYSAGRATTGRCADADGVRNNSLGSASAPFDLAPANAPYSCTATDAQGHVTGSLAWQPTAGDAWGSGTLTISGTIFLDGYVVVQAGGMKVQYKGRGTIYTNGAFQIRNGASVCAIAGGCGSTWQNTGSTKWDTSSNLLVVATYGAMSTSSSSSTGFDLSGGGGAQIAVYAEHDWVGENGTMNWAPVIANQLVLTGGSTTAIPNTQFPTGAPGVGQTIQVESGSYSG